MAAQGGWPGANPLLSALFGGFQQQATNHANTQDAWTQQRIAAATWEAQSTGQGELPDNATLEARGSQLLSEQGVNAINFGQYRGIANQWRTAKDALLAGDPRDQIRANSIFTPPWAQTTSDAVPSRYRVRVEWEVTPSSGDPFSTWGTYETGDPLTSIQDVLDRAGSVAGKKPTSNVPLGAQISGVSDYELEQI